MSKYRRITYEDHCQIYALSKRGASQESIAGLLGVSQSTVSREMPAIGVSAAIGSASESEGSSIDAKAEFGGVLGPVAGQTQILIDTHDRVPPICSRYGGGEDGVLRDPAVLTFVPTAIRG